MNSFGPFRMSSLTFSSSLHHQSFSFYLSFFSCGVVNFCVSSGLSVLVVFISVLCAILASAFYKYSSTRETMSETNDFDEEKSLPDQCATEPLLTSETNQINLVEEDRVNHSSSLSEVEINVEENHHEQTKSDEILMDTIEGSEEEIQKQQIANIYRLLNDQNLLNNWTTADFVDQLKMYGLNGYEEDELDSSQTSVE